MTLLESFCILENFSLSNLPLLFQLASDLEEEIYNIKITKNLIKGCKK